VATPHRERVTVGVKPLPVKAGEALPIEITMSMVRANSAVKIAGPPRTTSIRTFGAVW
jgi:hypothetical protein